MSIYATKIRNQQAAWWSHMRHEDKNGSRSQLVTVSLNSSMLAEKQLQLALYRIHTRKLFRGVRYSTTIWINPSWNIGSSNTGVVVRNFPPEPLNTVLHHLTTDNFAGLSVYAHCSEMSSKRINPLVVRLYDMMIARCLFDSGHAHFRMCRCSQATHCQVFLNDT